MTSFDNFLLKASDANVVPVVSTLPADLLTPLSVFLKLADDSKDAFLFESVEGGENVARYSFIGVDPEMTVRGTASSVTIDGRNGQTVRNMPLTEFLREHFAGRRVAQDPDLPSFIGGAIGCFDFDCAEWFEPSLHRNDGGREPEAVMMFFHSLVAFDHAKQLITIISLAFIADNDRYPETLRRLFENADSANKAMIDILENGVLRLPEHGNEAASTEVVSNWERADFENGVAAIKELIAAGECYQVVFSQCFTRETSASDVSIYRAMRSLNPSPYMFLLRTGRRSVVGASPEMLVRLRGKKLEYRPIAGTRRRGSSFDEDVRLAEEMQADKKEIAEHMMLVDLGRNDLGRVAEFGSISVDTLMCVEKYSHVQHMVSYLSGMIRNGFDRFDVFGSCFPAGTVSGAPKVRAIEIIRSLEPTPRGIYAGSVGYFDYAGNMDTCIAIRTLVLENGVAHVQAGAGIVADSVPAAEFEETVNKARALLKAVEMAEK